MAIFKQEVRNVAIHGEATGAFRVVPEEVNSSEFRTCSVRGNSVVFLKGSEEMVHMAAVAVLDAKVINNEDTRIGRHLWCHSPGVVAHW